MNKENRVCSFEQSKKLRELGIIQTANYYWTIEGELKSLGLLDSIGYDAAFTVAELGVMIPADYYLPTNKDDGFWWQSHSLTFEKTEAEARATMLIHLLEKNLITVEEVNNRLSQDGLAIDITIQQNKK